MLFAGSLVFTPPLAISLPYSSLERDFCRRRQTPRKRPEDDTAARALRAALPSPAENAGRNVDRSSKIADRQAVDARADGIHYPCSRRVLRKEAYAIAIWQVGCEVSQITACQRRAQIKARHSSPRTIGNRARNGNFATGDQRSKLPHFANGDRDRSERR